MTAAISRRTFAAGTAAWLGGRAFAAEGGALIVGVPSDPVTLDPALMASYFEIAVQFNLHEALLHLKPGLTLEPGLADWRQRDPLTYEFTLKTGLVFHDGEPIDAEAAKFSLDRCLDPAIASPRRAELAPVEKVVVTGPLTFAILLKTPYEPLLQVLALRAGMLVSPKAVRTMGAAFGARAVGAGPFRLESWSKNAELRLSRFDKYWRGPPGLERVVFRAIGDEAARLANLEAGTVQLIDAVPPQSVARLQANGAVTLKHRLGLGFHACSFNTTQPPFDDARARRAFVGAIDPKVILHAAYFDQGAVARGPIPPAVAWAYEDAPAAPAAAPQARLDPPLAVTLTIANAPAQIRVAEVIQAQAAEAGFSVSIRQVDPTSLISVLRKKDFDLCMSPWSGRSDPDGNMFGWFTIGGPQNFSGYHDAEVTRILEAARASSSRPERARLYKAAQARVAQDAPVLFFVFPETIQASARGLAWEQWPDGALQLQFARFV